MIFKPLALGLGMVVGLPHVALSCNQMSQHFWLCNRASPWEAAQWDQFGDGSTLILDDVVFNFTEEWPGHKIGPTTATLEELYTTYVAWAEADGNAPVEVLQSDVIDFSRGRALRYLQRDAFEDGLTTSALMLAQIGEQRIMLYLDAPETMPVAQMDVMSREILDMLHDNCADPISCAQDYQPPSAALQE